VKKSNPRFLAEVAEAFAEAGENKEVEGCLSYHSLTYIDKSLQTRCSAALQIVIKYKLRRFYYEELPY